jgi:hypothetical protein
MERLRFEKDARVLAARRSLDDGERRPLYSIRAARGLHMRFSGTAAASVETVALSIAMAFEYAMLARFKWVDNPACPN